MTQRRALVVVALFGVLAAGLFPLIAQAQIPLFAINDIDGGQEFSVRVQILILMTMLGFLPAMLIMMTSFTRFIIVLAILRQALGLQQSPPNNVLVGIALIMTLLVMRPVWQDIHDHAYEPFQADEITMEQALEEARDSISRFMLAQTNNKALETMMAIAGEEPPEEVADIPFSLLLPAFVLSELKTAFQLGFMIFIPFLVIDLIVSSVLMAMGMMMLSPMMISLPFKLMMFVAVDGWTLLMGTLATSIQPF
ncbi:flagellar biosynthetic protein FliP [Alkalilimnicola ehrlichii]|uniref:Flagellar biosynthetic protein FliP n=1 Tax=Alkalilimnicola ehrlichii TaxID=351052 RepID=A0A3E0X1U9_9GAMM|nr:flagellar type III secretion system pore protein FliP [Alkalilimnicola ehrlichii]RFA30726.1 flagellar biosynthetic protein FliP [Alkalilimnicola ehrlichii]RFA38302.1 flagellar biosynthetic protein FliP [Alkalilimnicola ehrlichii]